MSKLMPVDSFVLEAVTGGTSRGTSRSTPSTSSTRCTTSSDPLLQQLTSLANTIKDIGAVSKGMSPTEMLMLGLLMSQRSPVLYVRRPCFW